MPTTEKTTALSTENFLPWLDALQPPVNGPLGSDLVLRHFPDTWPVPGYHEKTSTVDPNSRDVDSLNSLLYKSYDLPARKEFLPDSALQELILPEGLRKTCQLATFSDATVFKAQLLRSGPAGKLYSLMATGSIPCTACDNAKQQTVEIWLSAAGGRIADLILVAYENGDDVQKEMRYYYLDPKDNLYLRDFIIEELSVGANKEEKWHFNKQHFTKIH